MIVETPRPSSPTSWAHAWSNSTSLDAFERFPSLSLSRWRCRPFRSPSGVHRGSRKQESPPSAWASTRNTSHIGAEKNHLWPVISYSEPGPPPFSGRATVVLERTSEPPWRSVIPIPISAPRFSLAGIDRRSYSSEVSRGSHSAARSGCTRSAGTPAYVIDSGQPVPDSTPDIASIIAARPRLDQRHVRLVDVVALERRSLVEDLAGRVLLDRRHQTGTLLSIGIAEVQKVTSPATRASRRSASRGLRASGPTRDSPIAPTRAAATVSVSCAASSPDSTPSRRTPARTSR